MFQIRPLPNPPATCPAGKDCCNSLATQTGHSLMTVIRADGSVRSLSAGLDRDVWRRMVNARDGESFSDN
jgi:hypothetical protein